MNLFHSARLKLTAFYFGILVVFCLVLTFGVQAFTGHELRRSDAARSGAVRRVFENFYDPTSQDPQMQPPPSGQFFSNTEQRQSKVTRSHLDHDFIIMDLGLLAVGAVVSYWYAGRTLRPIERAHEEQKRFTADASHELRTPLASMRLENEVFLRQKKFSDQDARDLIGSNLEEVARLERLATNLLALNQYEQGGLSKKSVDMADIVAEAVIRAERTEAAKSVKFIVNHRSGIVQVDSESIIELLVILLDNAVKYGKKNGTVTITGEPSDKGYTVTVHDEGEGIASEDMPHIFERMYRGDKARSNTVSGHGIGLSLAQQIAVANGARLTAGNSPEGGAVFTLEVH